LFPVLVIGAVTALALWKGGREERIVAAAFAVGTFAAPFLKDHSWAGTQWSLFAVDMVYLALLVVVALRSVHYWPLWAAGFQLLAILTHAASLIDRQLRPWAYVTAGVIWTYLGLAAIAVGTYNRWRERRQPAANDAAMAEPGATRL
jgi:hypothetical protein